MPPVYTVFLPCSCVDYEIVTRQVVPNGGSGQQTSWSVLHTEAVAGTARLIVRVCQILNVDPDQIAEAAQTQIRIFRLKGQVAPFEAVLFLARLSMRESGSHIDRRIFSPDYCEKRNL
jgi:hypothetical protein